MKKTFKKTSLAFACVLVAASAAFAGPGMADGGAKFLGNITTGNQVRSDFGQYWNQITAENECKWGSIHKSENQFNWDGCDRAYNWAKKNGGHFKFHALIWGAQYPSWISSLSAERTKEVIEKWMKAVADHYNPMGGIEMIDVVNEAIRTGENKYHSGYMGTKIIQALGGDNGKYTFVAEAFKMARKYFPNSVLIYNDYNTIQWHIDQGIDLIKQIKAQGAPVDAFGLQSHDVTGLGKSQFESALKKIHDAVQIPLVISEYDIEQMDDQKQKNDYANQIPFLWETEWVAGITLWGYIYGQTWLNCNGAANGCSGLIRNGQDRPAMTWLKEYFKENLSKGKNTTGIGGGEPPEPVPQEPFSGKPSVLPGKIEVEDYDKNGVGEGNTSFEDSDYENSGKSTYRDGDGVDIYDEGSGHVLGMTKAGEWLEYTVNFEKEGEYTVVTNAAAGGTGAAIKYYIDDAAVTDEIKIDQTADNKWDVYKDFSAKTSKIAAGEHVLKLEITGDYANIDYFTFKEGTEESKPPEALPGTLQMNMDVLEDYFVFDQQGVRLGTLSAYGFDAAKDILKSSAAVKQQGVYYLRSRSTGKVQSVRIVR